MSAARICLVVATFLALNACSGGGDIPPPAAPATPAPSAVPVAALAPKPALVARTPKPKAPPVAKPTLDLNSLKKQLKDTKAIGLFSKIALKNQVEDLLDQFRDFYKGKAKLTMMDLRGVYNLLMMKVLSLVQDEDQQLASAILSSRDAIWALLADPKKFAALEF